MYELEATQIKTKKRTYLETEQPGLWLVCLTAATRRGLFIYFFFLIFDSKCNKSEILKLLKVCVNFKNAVCVQLGSRRSSRSTEVQGEEEEEDEEEEERDGSHVLRLLPPNWLLS